MRSVCTPSQQPYTEKHREWLTPQWPRINSKVTQDPILEPVLSHFWVGAQETFLSHSWVTFKKSFHFVTQPGADPLLELRRDNNTRLNTVVWGLLGLLQGSFGPFRPKAWKYHLNFLDYTSPFYSSELISVIITPSTAPNHFRGCNKRHSLEKLHLVLSLLQRSTPPRTPIYSQRINWRNLVHLLLHRKLSVY